MTSLQKAIDRLDDNELYSTHVLGLLSILLKGSTNPSDAEKYCSEHNTSLSRLKDDLVDVLFDYLYQTLEDGVVTTEETKNFSVMMRFFGITPQDLAQHPDQAHDVLEETIRNIYQDHQVSSQEEDLRRHIMQLFGMSEDEFQKIEQQVLEGVEKHSDRTFFQRLLGRLGFCFALMVLFSTMLSSCQRTQQKVKGTWVDHHGVGFHLGVDGIAASVNNDVVQYNSWKLSKNNLILSGVRFERGASVSFCDTMRVEKVSSNLLSVSSSKGKLHLHRGL